jgi:hypothetical protein
VPSASGSRRSAGTPRLALGVAIAVVVLFQFGLGTVLSLAT